MRVYMIQHKAAALPEKKGYVSLQAGACFGHIPADYHDDTGDNISEKNRQYSELTGMYWIWKNRIDDQVGIVHYRRFFSRSFTGKEIIDAETLEKKLECCDIILPFHRTLGMTVREHYCISSGYEKDLIALEKTIRELFPEYLADFRAVMEGHRIYFFNMMVTSGEIYSAYCEWLFAIFSALEERISTEGYDAYTGRVFGFMGERLLTVYVRHHHLKVCELGVINTEEKWNASKRFLTGAKRFLLYYRRGRRL